MPKRLSYDEIYKLFAKHDCILLSEDYINNKTPLKYIASCGHERKSTLDTFKKWKRYVCKECTPNPYFKTGIGMHPKTYEKTIKVMERLYERTHKYRVDFLPENYNQLLTCWDCGKEKNRRLFPYRKQYKYNKEKRCKLCNLVNHQKRRENHTPDQVIQGLITTARGTSKKRDKRGRGKASVFNITVKDIKEIYKKQDGKCIFSGRKLTFIHNDMDIISIDRIDSNKGYIKSNIQLTTFVANQAKSNLTKDEFIQLCIDIVKSNGYTIR